MSTKLWLGLLPLISFAAGAVEAATLTVNTTDDFGPAGVNLTTMSLRAAISIINAGAFSPCGPNPCVLPPTAVCDITEPFGTNDTIRIHNSLIGETIELAEVLPSINKDVVIEVQGAGPTDRVTVRRNSADPFRIFTVNNDLTVTLDNLTITNGSAVGGSPQSYGGGVFVDRRSIVTINNSTISGNTAFRRGGGLYTYENSITIINNSTISNNTVSEGSGGGGIGHGGYVLNLTNVVLSDNRSYGFNSGGGGFGGGLYANTGNNSIGISNSTISDNHADGDGGGMRVRGGNLTIIDSLINDNTGTGSGGAIVLVPYAGNPPSGTINRSIISNNEVIGVSGSGGGISSSLPVSVTDSIISGNSVGGSGGGVSGSNFTITNSTISGNQATSGSGGGVFASGATTIVNSTISGNTAGSNGGGVRTSSTNITNSTIALNRAANGGGVYNSGASTLKNTIVAGNTNNSMVANDIQGTSSFSGPTNTSNLIGDAGSAGGLVNGTDGNIVGVGGSGTVLIDNILSALSPNDTLINAGKPGSQQPVLTHALVANSRALENADSSNCPATDQRGEPRPNPMGSTCDIGAFESSLRPTSSAPPAPPPSTPTPSPTPSPSPTPTPSPSPTTTPSPSASPTPSPSPSPIAPTITLTLEANAGSNAIPLDGRPVSFNRRELSSIDFKLISPVNFSEPFDICTILPVPLSELGITSTTVIDFFTATVNQVPVADLGTTEFPPNATTLPDACPTDTAPNGAVVLTLPKGVSAGDVIDVQLKIPPLP